MAALSLDHPWAFVFRILAKLMLALNVGLFFLIVLSTVLLSKGPTRTKVLRWMCIGFAVIVFTAPLSIIKQVIRTKSVDFMPFSLSFFLTLSVVAWFSYGLFIKVIYVTLTNILGFVFGVVQMILYIIYMDTEVVLKEDKLPEHVVSVSKIHEMKLERRTDENSIVSEDEAAKEGAEVSLV